MFGMHRARSLNGLVNYRFHQIILERVLNDSIKLESHSKDSDRESINDASRQTGSLASSHCTNFSRFEQNSQAKEPPATGAH